MKNGRVIADTIKNADAILEELLSLAHRADVLRDTCLPLDIAMKNMEKKKSPPVYFAETGRMMKERFIEDFSTEYPAIASGVMNGRMGTASSRMNDAVYKLGSALITMKEHKFMIIDAHTRQKLYDHLTDVVADVIIYTIIAFGLHKSVDGNETLAVSRACESRKITASVMYGNLMEVLKDTGRTYYAYEELSPLHADLLSVDPVFMAECEEQDLPLTEDIARQILSGELTTAAAMDQLLKESSDVESREIVADPISIITRMSLE